MSNSLALSAACPCGSSLLTADCCAPYIRQEALPKTPEQLMRSRYVAYWCGDYSYVLNTYAPEKRAELTVDELRRSDLSVHWVGLQVLSSENSTVAFKAYYRIDKQFFMLHELSFFKQYDNRWLYSSGQIQADSGPFKPERNKPYICGSGLKFKRCCGKN